MYFKHNGMFSTKKKLFKIVTLPSTPRSSEWFSPSGFPIASIPFANKLRLKLVTKRNKEIFNTKSQFFSKDTNFRQKIHKVEIIPSN